MGTQSELNAFNFVAGFLLAAFIGLVLGVLFHWVAGVVAGILVALGLNEVAPWFDYGAPS